MSFKVEHDKLHPEYEVMDWRGRSYFVDFMWILGLQRFVFEIMDFGSHGKDRTKYRMDLNRGLFLQSQGCHVFFVSLDEMKENPSFIRTTLQHALGSYFAAANANNCTAVHQFEKNERELCALRSDIIVSFAPQKLRWSLNSIKKS